MAARQTRRQLQFTGFEMGLIAVSFLVTVTCVFFLGLFVGKKNASYHAPAEDRVARIPVDDFTRYKRPAPIEKTPKEAPAATETVVAAATGAPAADAAAKSDAAKPVETAKLGPSGIPAAPAAATNADAAKTPAADATAAKDKDAAAKAAADAKAKEKAAKDAEAAAKKKEEEKKEDEEATGRGYTVQILATRKQADADALVAKLKSRGYNAYIKKVSNGAEAWYRVRVGSYGAFGEARVMADRCRHDLGLGQAFVSTE